MGFTTNISEIGYSKAIPSTVRMKQLAETLVEGGNEATYLGNTDWGCS